MESGVPLTCVLVAGEDFAAVLALKPTVTLNSKIAANTMPTTATTSRHGIGRDGIERDAVAIGFSVRTRRWCVEAQGW